MNFQWVKPMVLKGEQFLVRNASHILMALGTTGMATTVIFAAQAAPKAEHEVMMKRLSKTSDTMIEGGNKMKEQEELAKLTVPEWIKACGKIYIPTVGMGLFSLMCFWGAHGIDMRRQAILAGLYATAEQALQEYQRKVTELIGTKAEKEVKNAIAQDKVDALPPPRETVILSDDSDLWCIIDSQYFRSSYLKIKEAQNDANHEMIQHMYISQSDLYWLLDPERKYLKPGPNSAQIGWNVDEMLYLDVDTAMGPDHKPILSVNYRTKDGFDYAPQAGYSRML